MRRNNIVLNKLIEIYRDLESNSFMAGFVIKMDEENIIIRNIEPNGKEYGITLMKINDICLIKYDTQYLDKIKRLFKHSENYIDSYQFNSGDLVLELLNYSLVKHDILALELINSNRIDIVGRIKNLTKDEMELEVYDELGRYNGVAILEIEDISGISLGIPECLEVISLAVKTMN